MENAMVKSFRNLSEKELDTIDGGGVIAFVYALGFMAGTAPLAVVIGAGIVVVGTGLCIYGACNH